MPLIKEPPTGVGLAGVRCVLNGSAVIKKKKKKKSPCPQGYYISLGDLDTR